MQKNSSYVLIETSMLVVKVSSEVFLTKYNQFMKKFVFQFENFFCLFVCVCEILLNIAYKSNLNFQNK